jgi:hypothetical protein
VRFIELSKFRPEIQPVRLSVLPLAIAAIVLTTAVPVELRPAVWWDGGFDGTDFLQNLLLYAPLGVALSRGNWWVMAAVPLALSAGAELIQMWSFERYSSPYDVVANVLGSLAGAWVWRRRGVACDSAQIVLTGFSMFGCLVIALLMFAIWKLPLYRAELRNWDPSFRVLLGNETTANRPWKGTIADLRILLGAFTPEELGANDEKHGGLSKQQVDAVTLYHSSAPIRLDGGPAISLPQSVGRDLAERIPMHGAFTLLVDLTTEDLIQKGPARIVSFSKDTSERNFDLGQEQDQLTLRVRTPVSGPSGEHFRVETPSVLKTHEKVRVVASNDGAVSRIFVNGALYGRSNLAGAGCTVRTMCDAAVPLVWSIFGAVTAICALALMPPRPKHWVRSLVAATLVAGSALVILQLMQLVPQWVLNPPWMKYMIVIGAVTVVIAAHLEPAAAEEMSPVLSDEADQPAA